MHLRLFSMLFCVLSLSLSAGEGSLKGTVKLDGEAPAPKVKNLEAQQKTDCKHDSVTIEDLVVDPASKGIQWVIVKITNPVGDAPAPAEKMPEIDQKGCKFSPHVTIVTPGQPISFLNPDGVGHNIHSIPLDATNPPVNSMMGPGQPSFTMKAKSTKEPELIQVQCDIHPWMKGYILVHNPKFAAVTDKEGKFEIKGLPPGKYKVSLFQEALGDKPAGANAEGLFEVEVKDGAATDMGEIKFKAK